MKKIIKKRFYLLFLFSLFLIQLSTPTIVKAGAFNLMGGYTNYNGISGQKFWCANNTTQWQKQNINDMMYNWNSSNGFNVYTKMNVGPTQNRASSIMDFSYTRTWYDNGGRTGETSYWIWDKKVNYGNGMPYSNWSSTLVQFGGPAWAQNSGDFSDHYNQIRFKQQTFAHEIGHSVGLAHNDDRGYQTTMRTHLINIPPNLRGPYFNDLYGVNYLYR